MQWIEIGDGAALALLVDRVAVAMIVGPTPDGYRLNLKPCGTSRHYPHLEAAKSAAEQAVRRSVPDESSAPSGQ